MSKEMKSPMTKQEEIQKLEARVALLRNCDKAIHDWLWARLPCLTGARLLEAKDDIQTAFEMLQVKVAELA